MSIKDRRKAVAAFFFVLAGAASQGLIDGTAAKWAALFVAAAGYVGVYKAKNE